MAAQEKIVVLVHGWSVHNTDTYGELPAWLQAEAKASDGLKIDFHNIWLGKYVSFRDEVKLEDVEPGEGILDWLELGSAESWKLNKGIS